MRAPGRRILTVRERQQLQAEMGTGPLGLEAADVGTGGVWYQAPNAGPMNPVELAEKRRRLQGIMDAGAPRVSNRAQKVARDREIRGLEEELRKDVIPRQHYDLKRQDSTDYNKVVSTLAGQMTDPRRRAKEDRLKNLRREREPEDPNAGKITDLREDRRIAA